MQDPISRRFPTEVASLIFQSYIEDTTPADLIWSDPENQPNPLMLGAVCSAWRSIAWSTPQLWTALSLVFDRPTDQARIETLTDITEQWLDRAGHLPLSITFRIEGDCSDDNPSTHAMFHRMVDLIERYSARWCTLSFDLPSDLFPRFFHDLVDMSMVDKLALGSSSYPEMLNDQIFPEECTLAPSHATISNIHLDCFNIYWDNITYVEINFIPMDECLELLRCAPRLQTFVVSEVTDPDGELPLLENSDDPILHANLEDVQLTVFGNNQFSSDLLDFFFANTKLPALRSLFCQLLGRDFSLSSAVMTSFFNRSSCRLSSLHLSGNMANIDFMSITRSTPDLKKLHLTTHYPPSSVFNGLFEVIAQTSSVSEQSSPSEVFLPLLQELVIWLQIDDRSDFGWHLLPNVFGPVRSIDSKVRRPLTRLDVTVKPWNYPFEANVPNLGPELLAKFLELRNAGISLRLLGSNKDLLSSS